MASAEAGKVALCFPGQGAHNARMLDNYAGMKEFAQRYSTVCDALGFKPLDQLAGNPHLVNTNSLSSLMTVLASSLSYSRYLEETGTTPDFVSGYSVGQYTALYASGCFDFDDLVKLVKKRADLMDECFKNREGSMMSIVGVPLAAVESLVTKIRSDGEELFISNYNCFGQYSLAGTKSAIQKALAEAEALEPKRLLELPVGGAWHCPLLSACTHEFHSYLQSLVWEMPGVPVVDNVTGRLMPDSISSIKAQLAKHLTHPVRWEDGINTLIGLSCRTFIEIGFGNVLTRFGFFIDRSLNFKAYSGPVIKVCAE